MSRPDRIAEQKLVDQLTPELRALVYEYGLQVVMSGIATTNSHDPERVKKFAEANRRKAQEILEAECSNLGHGLLRRGFGIGRL
jgi:hypothetical protein